MHSTDSPAGHAFARKKTISFDLIGLEVKQTGPARIALGSSRAHLRQGFGFLLFMSAVSLAIAGAGVLMFYAGERRDAAPASSWAIVAAAAGLPILYGLGSLVRTYRLHFEINRSENHSLEFAQRGWGSRTCRENLFALRAIEVAAVPVTVETTAVNNNRIHTVGRFWVWYLAVEFVEGSSAKELQLRMQAEEYRGIAPEQPPALVMQLAQWLQTHTGKKTVLRIAP